MASAGGEQRDELVREMRSNANRLSDTLESLLRRIEQLEDGGGGGGTLATKSGRETTEKIELNNGGEVRREYISWDTVSGRRKMVTVTERLLPVGNVPLREQSSTFLSNGTSSPSSAAEMLKRPPQLASVYESRVLKVPQPEMMEKIELQQICGQHVVVGIPPELFKFGIRLGDILLEIDGQPLTNPAQLHCLSPYVQIKVVQSDLYTAPLEFIEILEDYPASQDTQQLPYLSFSLRRGDILQVMSRGAQQFQARKVSDFSASGFVPTSLVRLRPVGLLSPFGRRVVLLLGANGVGRRTLKRMLIEQRAHLFAGVVPVTSREARPGEQNGCEYLFERKEDILQRIRDRQMVEWGEYQGALYGTTAESVRRVIRSGRVCVLDCNARALDTLYNAEFMPYVVVVASPPLNEMVQLSKMGGRARAEEDLRRICAESEQLLKGEHAGMFDLVLVNRNRDISLKRLLDALETLKTEPQWVPLEWIQKSGKK